MNIEIQAFIVLSLPVEPRAIVQKLRSRYDSYTASLPVEITLVGSSGVGPIEPGQDIERVIEEISSIIPQFKPFSMSFSRITSFPNTDIYYLEPTQRDVFDEMHLALSQANIAFQPNPFPYNPHCSICVREELTSEDKIEILSEDFIREDFTVDTLQVFEYQYCPAICQSVFEMRLG